MKDKLLLACFYVGCVLFLVTALAMIYEKSGSILVTLFFGFYWFFSILYFAGMEFYIYYQYDDMKNVAIVYQEVETIRVIS